MSPAPIAPRVLDEAADWLMQLNDSSMTDADRAACERWRQSDPEHARAWSRAELLLQKFGGLPPQLAMPALSRPAGASRRAAVARLAAVLALAPVGWAAWQLAGPRAGLDTYETATGARRDVALPDGTQVSLSTATAINVKFDSYQRTIYLRSGAILITTATDPAPQHRPFVVATAQGRLRALGTRFTVRQSCERSYVAVQGGAVEVSPAQSTRTLVVQAGEQAYFTASDLGDTEAAGPHGDAWTRGVLYARNMRLQDFAAELGRYRPGVLRCDPAVADLRISGAFQLRDTTPVLDSLPQALPVDVLYRTRYWVTLLPPGGA